VPGRAYHTKTLPLPRGSPEGGGGLKSAFAGGDLHNSKLPKSWQNSEKTGAKAAIFGQKVEKTEQKMDKKGQTTDKLGIRNDTHKTALSAQKKRNNVFLLSLTQKTR